MARKVPCWSYLREQHLVWLHSPGGRLKDDAVSASLAAGGLEVGRALWPEEMSSAGHLKLSIPFFREEQIGAAALMGPIGLDQIVAFCAELKQQLAALKVGHVLCVCCSDRTGARANSLLLVGAYLMLECGLSAKDMLRDLFPPKLGFAAHGLRFPLPWVKNAEFSEYSLTLLDCFLGLEAASEYSWWDYKRHDPAKRIGTIMSYDATPVCKVCVAGLQTEEGCSMSLWVSADPVTTVKDPHSRPEPPVENVQGAKDLKIELPTSPTSPEEGKLVRPLSPSMSSMAPEDDKPMPEPLSTPSTKSIKSTTSQIRFMRGKSAQSSLTLASAQELDPMSEWRERAPTPTKRSKSLLLNQKDPPSKNASLGHPSKDAAGRQPGAKAAAGGPPGRPLDLEAFAGWLRGPIGCRLIVRANQSNERGLPGGSYGDFFSRRSVPQLDVPFTDGTAPPNQIVERALAKVVLLLQELQLVDEFAGTPCSVVVHCKSGLGRSMSLIGALAVTLTPELSASAYFGWARLVRPGAIQTAHQERFLRALDEESLTRSCAKCCRWWRS